MHLVVVGMSHHNAPVAIREQVSCPDYALPGALTAAVACPGVREAVLLSTCNRLEMYAVVEAGDANAAFFTLRRHLARFHDVAETVLAPYLYCRAETEAVTHLLRVAGGLDSLVLGEAQILGQVRGALRQAQASGTVGSGLTTLFQQAIAGARRVQTETGLGRGAFSIGHAAVDLAGRIFSDLSHASVLILGAGKMSELTARHLVASGVRFVMVANRTFAKADELAARLGGKAIQYEAFPDALATADIVIASTAAPHPIVTRELLSPILRRRRGKPLFFIDIAVPRDVASDVDDLDNVFVYNIDDLQTVVSEEAGARAGEAVRAESLLAEETTKFMAWYRAREAAPVIEQFRARLERIRQDDLAILRAKLGPLADREWQAIEMATKAMMNKVAREPILRLKQAAQPGEPGAGPDAAALDLVAATRSLFNLPGAEQTEQTMHREAATAFPSASELSAEIGDASDGAQTIPSAVSPSATTVAPQNFAPASASNGAATAGEVLAERAEIEPAEVEAGAAGPARSHAEAI